MARPKSEELRQRARYDRAPAARERAPTALGTGAEVRKSPARDMVSRAERKCGIGSADLVARRPDGFAPTLQRQKPALTVGEARLCGQVRPGHQPGPRPVHRVQLEHQAEMLEAIIEETAVDVAVPR